MLTDEEQRLMQALFHKIQQAKPADRENERYYRGIQDIGNLGIAIPPDVQPFAFPLNWCRTYASVLAERMEVRMILRSGETSEDKELREDWESNDLDASLPLLVRDFIVLGRCALSVAADPDGGRPRIRVESPKNLATIVDPITRATKAALRIYRAETGRATHMTLYLPNETIMISRRAGKWEAVQRIEHGLGRVPVVMAFNQDTSDDVWKGETQFSDLKPLVNMAGRVMLQLQMAMETVSTPQKIALGVARSDFQDEHGNPVDEWETYLGSVWAISTKGADVKQLPGADLAGFHKTITMLAEQAATVTGLPVRMMGQNTANPAAEGSIRADESRLVKQVDRMSRAIGSALAWSLGVAERIRRHAWESDGKISILWHDPGTPTEAQRADALSKKTGGKPVLSVRGALLELGFTQARIDKELQWLEQERESYLDIRDTKFERAGLP
ncbi:phage portal protein [Corynebacterium riegelii]|uniref:phage portal protein n=1 Tax=Corynebacterium riegelii TaxID=156976 RepID=UPI002551968B|nr:phage portal protein [Corynebacterium riegelii]MDK7179954.1 phage portal protein [Corynebacterium riegelii]